MRTERFRVTVIKGAGGRGVIAVPFDPDELWGVKAMHHVGGTVNGQRVRVTLERGEHGWAFSLNQNRLAGTGASVGADADIELTPEGPQRADLGADFAAALEEDAAAGAF